MEVQHPADHEGRPVVVAPGVGRTVVGLRDPDVAGAVEQALDRDACLGTGERGADTRVDAVPECNVLAGVRAVDAKLIGTLKLSRVAVRGTDEDLHGGAGGKVDPVYRRRHPRQPKWTLERAVEAKDLLDEVSDQISIVAEPPLELGVFCDPPERRAEQVNRGLLPGTEQVRRDPDHLVYFREEVGGLLMGGYERSPAPWGLDGIAPDFNSRLLDEDWPRFEELMENALVRVPALEKDQVAPRRPIRLPVVRAAARPGNADFPDITLELEVSPKTFFAYNPFGEFDEGEPS